MAPRFGAARCLRSKFERDAFNLTCSGSEIKTERRRETERECARLRGTSERRGGGGHIERESDGEPRCKRRRGRPPTRQGMILETARWKKRSSRFGAARCFRWKFELVVFNLTGGGSEGESERERERLSDSCSKSERGGGGGQERERGRSRERESERARERERVSESQITRERERWEERERESEREPR
jgi:hypothetical protein